MRPNTSDLPSALRPIATSVGLEYLSHLASHIVPFPVACAKLPVFKDVGEIESLPVQMNFHAVVLDMDKKEDQEEYERAMTYLASGYGMKLVHIERILVSKRKTKNGVTRRQKVRRIYLEYYAPYRVLISTEE